MCSPPLSSGHFAGVRRSSVLRNARCWHCYSSDAADARNSGPGATCVGPGAITLSPAQAMTATRGATVQNLLPYMRASDQTSRRRGRVPRAPASDARITDSAFAH